MKTKNGPARGKGSKAGSQEVPNPGVPTPAQARWLQMGLSQAGGKLPLFDTSGAAISPRTVRACIAAGWAEPWFFNPIKPDWLVCKLTEQGRTAVAALE
ncbi:hypothetical protein [Roseibium aestuarii]|uniref:Outer-membrane lipoprotein LolB n=1 Tax=Roseibium aestuarii TaxID=2600299 RepID=A0ABW4JYL6_9HYPH|nr:hypothetical protein [Roseibium aestuarii]